MADEDGKKDPADPAARAERGAAGSGRESTAADDLAGGLDLMLRAARKAVRSLDPRIEQVGKRALERLEHLDPASLGEVGRRVADKVDPKKLEQVAEDAGREIASLVERVAGRIETALGRRSEPPKSDEETGSGPDAAKSENEPPARKVRIDDA